MSAAPVQLALPTVGKLDADFADWATRNQPIIDRAAELACDVRRRGKKCGIKAILEQLRWETFLASDDPASDWKINNTHGSRLARLLMERVPELDGFFEVRSLRSSGEL